MNLRNLLFIPLLIAGIIVGCSVTPTGVLSDDATDAGQTFHVLSTFRINDTDNVTQVVVEGHQYVIYDAWNAGGIVHSASCPHPSHPGMGEIY